MTNSLVRECGFDADEDKGISIFADNFEIQNCTFKYNWYGIYANNGAAPGGHGGGSQSFFRVGWNGDGSFKNTTTLDMINARNNELTKLEENKNPRAAPNIATQIAIILVRY